MQSFGRGLDSLRIPGINQNFRPEQVEFHPARPQHRGDTPMDHLIRSGYYEVSQGVFGVHVVPAHLVYFNRGSR